MSEESPEVRIARLEERFDAAEKALRLAYIQSIVAAVLAGIALFHK